MISKKLIQTVPDAKQHVIKSVLHQLLSLFANIYIMWTLGGILEALFTCVLADSIGSSFMFTSGQREKLFLAQIKLANIHIDLISMIGAIFVRIICAIMVSYESHYASNSVKLVLREKIYNKMLRLGSGYTKKMSTAEVLQVTVEGVDQLEQYFGNYLPQFFYAMLAPLLLFIAVSFLSVKTAVVLLLCVPMIPISIIVVQKFAKKLLAKYWGEYTGLGDHFLENLQGLNTLKIYGADEMKHQEMNVQAERFRKITMRVLTMQLNSISVMDIMAYGGTALGIILAVTEYTNNNITLGGVFVIILLCSDFFLPMRLLGSYFHIAMNGMAASKKIFSLLDMEEVEEGTEDISSYNIKVSDMNFSYEEGTVLDGINLEIPGPGVYAMVGASGSGKSTMAGILSGHFTTYEGSVTYGDQELSQVSAENIRKAVTVVGLGSYIFKGTVRENLYMGNPDATDEQLWSVLEDVNLSAFLKEQDGLDTLVSERGSNFSGGQCQRFAMARALLHDSPVYIFDEATSNIDVDSENEIMSVVKKLGEKKPVILISHRLANVVDATNIFVLESGKLVEEGTHETLITKKSTYERLWNTQQQLESLEGVAKGGNHEK